MIRHIWSVLCSQSVRDADSQNVSLFNVIEQIRASIKEDATLDAVHLLPVPLQLVTLWESGDWERDEPTSGEVAQASIRLLAPAGTELGASEVTADLVKHRRCRTVLRFEGLPITLTGRYVVQVLLHDAGAESPRLVAEVPIDVQVTRIEAEQAPATTS